LLRLVCDRWNPVTLLANQVERHAYPEVRSGLCGIAPSAGSDRPIGMLGIHHFLYADVGNNEEGSQIDLFCLIWIFRQRRILHNEILLG
jgi:hypothetical protein